jgi:beta-N-acetylglucosaminidase
VKQVPEIPENNLPDQENSYQENTGVQPPQYEYRLPEKQPSSPDPVESRLRMKRYARIRLKLIMTIIVVVIIGIGMAVASYVYVDSTNKYSRAGSRWYDSGESIQISQVLNRLESYIDNMDVDSLTAQIESGSYGLSDYLLRVFTSPSYLSSQADDTKFISDSYFAISGEQISTERMKEAELLLQSSGSRLVWLDYLCEQEGVPDRLSLEDEPTGLRSLTMVSDLPEYNDRIIGLLPISAEIKMAGANARIKLFSDGHLQQNHSYELLGLQSADSNNAEANNNIVTVYWDTRYENSGGHKLDYLVQTSDGRGTWISLDSFIVPEINTLDVGKISALEIPAGIPDIEEYDQSREAWYLINSPDNLAMIMLYQADADLNLELYNVMGEKTAVNTSREGIHAALRYQGDDLDLLPLSLRAQHLPDSQAGSSDATSYYVRVFRTTEKNELPVHYSLVQAETVAVTVQSPYRYAAVMAIEDDQLLIQDDTGTSSWQSADNYQLLAADSSLGMLHLKSGANIEIDYAPEFSSDHKLYGLYAGADTTSYEMDTWTIEGSASNLEIDLLYEDGTSQKMTGQDTLEIKPSINTLRISVTGFKGDTNVYELKILRTPDSEGYHQVLETFPLSYRTPLWAVHLQQPTWQFDVNNTNIDWVEFMTAQDRDDKNLVDANYSPYHWVEENSPVYDGASWKAAAIDVIEYFADPRHALNTVDIFQFESLRYEPEVHTLAGIEAMLENTFMASGNEYGIDYAALIHEAGQAADISPFFIAAKIIQEMGPQGQSLLAHGELPDYEGIYNFYNIGSTPNPEVENGALINGARFASLGKDPSTEELDDEEKRWLIPWNTPERAITGGAIWIADRYVAIGQDTLYGQKFDLIADPDLFLRQYAQNIQMAWAEGRRTYRAYDNLELLSEPFVFKIPVFMNMPPEVPEWP